jgi:hypothetical protein
MENTILAKLFENTKQALACLRGAAVAILAGKRGGHRFLTSVENTGMLSILIDLLIIL